MSDDDIEVYPVIVGAALPDLGLFVRVDGKLLDLHTGFTFSLRVRDPLDAMTLFTKTTGWTGAVGSGSEPGGTPNLVGAWALTGETDQLTGGEYHKARLTIVRSADTKPLKYDFLLAATADL